MINVQHNNKDKYFPGQSTVKYHHKIISNPLLLIVDITCTPHLIMHQLSLHAYLSVPIGNLACGTIRTARFQSQYDRITDYDQWLIHLSLLNQPVMNTKIHLQ